jgi:hypothetical protein
LVLAVAFYNTHFHNITGEAIIKTFLQNILREILTSIDIAIRRRSREGKRSTSTGISDPDPDWIQIALGHTIRSRIVKQIQIQAGQNCRPKKEEMKKFPI